MLSLLAAAWSFGCGTGTIERQQPTGTNTAGVPGATTGAAVPDATGSQPGTTAAPGGTDTGVPGTGVTGTGMPGASDTGMPATGTGTLGTAMPGTSTGPTSSMPGTGMPVDPVPTTSNGMDDGQGGAPEIPTEPATCMGTLPTGAVDGTVHSVNVDSATVQGALPHFWNTYGIGHHALFLEQERGWGELLKAHVVDGVKNLGLTSIRAHGLFHDDMGIYHEVDGVPVYDFSKSDEIFDFLVDNKIEPIVELASMPNDLASDPTQTYFLWEMGKSPPKDFQRWQELIYNFTAHSVERYGAETVAKWYFEVWNEPECCSGQFWTGTLDQYYELYDHSAAAVHAALPNGRVGGPVASQPRELTAGSALGQHFLEHVTTDNYVTPGMPGTLEFFVYHSWSFIDGSVNGYFNGLDLLDSFGFNDVGIAITEFGPTWEFNLFDEPQENRHGAAFVAQTYADIAQRCAREKRRFPITYAWWVLSDVFEEDKYREDDPFIGCMGLTSRQNIHKPAYNVYHFLAQMGTEQVPLTVTGAGNAGGMASRDADGGVQILIYNGQGPGKGPADNVYYAVTEAQSIGVTVGGLDMTKPYDVTSYRVDEARGNAYAKWEEMNRPTMTNMTEENWQSLRDNMDSPAEPIAQSLCGSTFSQSFSLSSPGVLFVTLTPTQPVPIAQ